MGTGELIHVHADLRQHVLLLAVTQLMQSLLYPPLRLRLILPESSAPEAPQVFAAAEPEPVLQGRRPRDLPGGDRRRRAGRFDAARYAGGRIRPLGSLLNRSYFATALSLGR
jgi:hypothetical protein